MKRLSLPIAAAMICCTFFPIHGFAESQIHTPAETLPGIYEFVTALDSDFLIDLRTCTQEDAQTDDSSLNTLQLFTSCNVNQQKFYIDQLVTGQYRISTLNSGQYLSADCSDNSYPPSLSLADFDNTKEQQKLTELNWTLEDAGDGFFYLSQDGFYLTVDDSHAYLGTSLTLKPFTGKMTQKWQLRRTRISSEAYADTDFYNPYGENGEHANLRLSMQFGTHKETLTADIVSNWITEENHTLVLNPELCQSYAAQLANRYDTQGKPRTFTTAEGSTITLYKGNFGWKLDTEKTAALLLDAVQSSDPTRVLSPVWSHKGTSFSSENDIGDSYVEIDLTNQKVWLFKDGRKLLETDCVTGTYNTDRQTPGGVYSIYYRQSPAVLRGADYASPVDYWMAFNGNIGLHDASWRSSFGDDIYLTSGSHGCVNLPTDAAKTIYEETYYGYPVVCYN